MADGAALRAPVYSPCAWERHPAVAWAESGLMALTGERDGPPLMCPAPLAACADGALAALAALGPSGLLDGIRGAELLAERAALTGHFRAGPVSPGGGCRLLEAADGELALTLARDEDWGLVPAWLERAAGDWDAVAAAVRERPCAELAERGRLVGLALGWFEPQAATNWFEVSASGPRTAPSAAPRVVDLSSLWAGPLCSHLLQKLGGDVTKVESATRPDGARRGVPVFFDLLNEGKRCVAVDFASDRGRGQLRELILGADIVIEGSRPRALRQLGIVAEELLLEKPGLTWIAIGAHGRDAAREHWAGYGDDAAVAAGLSDLMRRAAGVRVLVGDAIADPLTGIHAALAAWASWRSGGGRLLSVSLSGVVRHCLAFDRAATDEELRERQAEWTAMADGHLKPPRARVPRTSAGALGADNAIVLR